MQIAICDDDPHMRAYLSSLCRQRLADCHVHEYSNGKQLLSSPVDFDNVLMDIQPGELDSLQAVRQLRAQAATGSVPRPAVIFITAFDEHVFEALDFFPFHFLLKPLDEKKLERVLSLAANSCPNVQEESAILFHSKEGYRKLYPGEIDYVESSLRKVVIHTAWEALEIYATMDSLEKKLGPGFFRCHRGYLVNLGKITGYNKKTIRLRDGTELLIAQSKYSSFINAYMQFLKRGEEP